MDESTRRLVRTRAKNRCEYCGLHQDDSPLAPLQIEHIVPRKHSGGDEENKLALVCIALIITQAEQNGITRYKYKTRIYAAAFE